MLRENNLEDMEYEQHICWPTLINSVFVLSSAVQIEPCKFPRILVPGDRQMLSICFDSGTDGFAAELILIWKIQSKDLYVDQSSVKCEPGVAA